MVGINHGSSEKCVSHAAAATLGIGSLAVHTLNEIDLSFAQSLHERLSDSWVGAMTLLSQTLNKCAIIVF